MPVFEVDPKSVFETEELRVAGVLSEKNFYEESTHMVKLCMSAHILKQCMSII